MPKKSATDRKPYAAPKITELDPTDARAIALRAEVGADDDEPTIPLIGDAIADARADAERQLETVQGQYQAAKGFLIEAEQRSAELRKVCRHVVVELRKGDGAAIAELTAMLERAILPPETPATERGAK